MSNKLRKKPNSEKLKPTENDHVNVIEVRQPCAALSIIVISLSRPKAGQSRTIVRQPPTSKMRHSHPDSFPAENKSKLMSQ